MTSLREFFSLPTGSRGAGRDTPVGVDELGRTVYVDQLGQQYTMGEAAPIAPADIRGAIAGGAEAFLADPVGTGGNALAALAEAAWNGVEAPANALRGLPMTYGDVADTALDWGVLGAVGSAPEGALRSMAWNDLPMYHGTPDVRGLREAGGFAPRTRSVSYIADPDRWDEVQAAMRAAEPQSDEYFRLLDEAAALRSNRSITDPAFFSPDRPIAASYADDRRAFDYQNAEPAVVEARTTPTRPLDVNAGGETFRGIDQQRVIAALQSAGVADEDITRAMRSLSHTRDGRMSTDDLAIVAQDLGFDAVDVANVVDTYNATGRPGRVRMMLDPSQIDVPAFRPPDTPAQTVARLLSEGRASEVTDDLMAQVDPQEMARLYESGATGMDMPLDEASRMARAREMGFADDQYHATIADFPAFMPSQTGLAGRGVYSGDFAGDVADYARVDGSEGLNIAPLRTPPESSYARRIDWQNTVDADPVFPYDATVDETVAGFARAADEMAAQGYAGVLSQPGERVTFNPANIRSRFARFDPRLSHLANLSAGIGAAGIALPYLSDDEASETNALRAYVERF